MQGLQRWSRNKLRPLRRPPGIRYFSPIYFSPSPSSPPASGQDDGGGVDAGAAAADGALLLRAAVLLLAGPARGFRREVGRVDGGGEQIVRGGAGAGRPQRARPVGEGGGDAAPEDGRRRDEPLQRPRERRRLHRGRARAVPALQRLAARVRVHPRGLGRRRRRLQARLLSQARARPGPGAQEGRPLDGGGAQVVLDGAEEVREGGLEEHLAQVRDDADADAGGQPRAEVLHPAQLRRQGQAPLQHPRHHHREPPRRGPRQRLALALAAVRRHEPLRRRPVRRPRGREALRAAARRGAPLRRREAGAQGRARGRPRLRRLGPPADAMRGGAVVTGGSWRGENRAEERTAPSRASGTGQVAASQAVVLGFVGCSAESVASGVSVGWHGASRVKITVTERPPRSSG